MSRFLFTLSASLLAAAAAPVLAQNGGGGFYTAQLAAPAAESEFAAGGVVWRCEETSCRAARSNARPVRVCSGLRREVGTLTGFSAGGEQFAPEELARCNG